MASGKAKAKEATIACQATLAARLLKRISYEAAAAGNNLVFSPLSMHVALALMSTAAAGATLEEILLLAGAPSRREVAAFLRETVVDGVLADQSGVSGLSISFACGTWTDKAWPLRPSYVDAIVGTFKGSSGAVDFQNKNHETINVWVSKATRNLVTRVLGPEDDKALRMTTLTRCTSLPTPSTFKGEWHNPLKKEHTIDHEFHCLDESTVEVAFLQSWSYQCIGCHARFNFKVLKLV